MVQKSGHPVPSYELLFKGGPPHQPVFRVVVKTPWDGRVLAEEGQGNTRKAAEKNAAERLLQRICGRKQLPLLPPLEEGGITEQCVCVVCGCAVHTCSIKGASTHHTCTLTTVPAPIV